MLPVAGGLFKAVWGMPAIGFFGELDRRFSTMGGVWPIVVVIVLPCRPHMTMPLAALGIATISLTGCATVASDPRVATVCPPVVEYSRDFQARATDEPDLLPEGSAITEMLADYSVMRDQARSCRVSF
ncbi:hypothetical protein [Limibacillus sp. MBR-115]|jgi:hypothetical protein|uniref:hypothetical protein n=1 Tax=Limibacillus sp. MBR-115 TaxID=3156465 RepID=UPI00339A023C